MRRAREGFGALSLAVLRFELSPSLPLVRGVAPLRPVQAVSSTGSRFASTRERPQRGAPSPCQHVTQRIGLTEVSTALNAKSPAALAWRVRHTTSDELTDSKSTGRPTSTLQSIIRYVRGHTANHFKALFLPTGYPATVKPNYERYITMQALQNTIASTNAIVSSTFLLYAVGLDSGAIPVAGALNWIIKDGVGQIGTLVFGRLISHDFDLRTRSWHFWSALTINVACAAEIVTAWFPGYFLLLGSLANMLKGLSWMAGGSTRAAFNVSFARGENIADLTAKGTSQFICTNLVGTAAGVIICSVVGTDAGLALACSAVLGTANAVATYATIRSVPLATLNHTRMQLLMDQYLALNLGRAHYAPVPLSSPSHLCTSDPVVHIPVLRLDARFEPAIEVGTPLSEVLNPLITSSKEKLSRLLRVHAGARHLLVRDGRQRSARLHLILHADATPADSVAAMLHAVLLRRAVQWHAHDTLSLADEALLTKRTLRQSAALKGSLLESLRSADWNLDRVCIETHLYRATW